MKYLYLYLLFIFIKSDIQINQKIRELPIACINQSGSSPIDLLNLESENNADFKSLSDCLLNHFDDPKEQQLKFKEKNDGNFYTEYYQNNSLKIVQNWMTTEISDFNRYTIEYLAAIRPEAKVFKHENSIIIFDQLDLKYNAWTWIFSNTYNSEEVPLQSKIMDLYDPKSLINYANYLKKGNNFNESPIPELIQELKSNPNSEFVIKAFLPDSCVANCMEEEENSCISSDKNFDSTICMDNFYSSETNIDHHLLLERNDGTLEIVLQNSDSFNRLKLPNQIAELLNSSTDKSQFAKRLICCYRDCRSIDLVEDELKNVDVIVCSNGVEDIYTNGKNYSLFDDIDIEERRSLINNLYDKNQSFVNSYKTRLLDWASKDFEAEDQLLIRNALVPIATFDCNEDLTSLINNAKPDEVSSNINYLLRKPSENKYYIWNGINEFSIRSIDWLQLPEFSTLAKNSMVNKLLLLGGEIGPKYFRDDIFCFILKWNNNYQTYAWRIDPITGRVTEKNIFKHIPRDNCSNNLYSQELSKLYFSKTVRINKSIREQLILAFNDSNTNDIIQVFSKIVADPIIYGPEYYLESDNVLPTKLKKSILNGDELTLLLSDGKVYNGTNYDLNQGQRIVELDDPWFSWMYLADKDFILIGDEDYPTDSRIIFSSRQDSLKNLWGISSSISGLPNFIKVIDGMDVFKLTNKSYWEYVESLSDLKVSREVDFFLGQMMDLSFELMDFYEAPERIILYKYEGDDINLFRLNNNLNQSVPVKLYVVDNNQSLSSEKWDTLAIRYIINPCLREDFYNNVLVDDNIELMTWIGPNKIGFFKSDIVGIRGCGLTNISNDRFNSTYSDIQLKVNQTIFKPLGLRRPRTPDLNDFFHSWVDSSWNSNIWRANPLGYFDVNLD